MSQKSGYQQRRDDAAEAVRASSRDGREIAPLPKVANPRRRRKASGSLLAFLNTYFPDTFNLAWSADHLEAVAEVERLVRDGGQLALAMPRGVGKTSIAVRAALWALLTGLREFVVLVAASQGLADKLITVMRAELQFNEKLAEDWPEACYPIRRLENITKRQTGQTLDGRPTLIRLATDELVLPTVRGAKSSGGIVRAVGLTGSVRGQIATTADGRSLRPSLILCDDPQDRESAKSPTQVSYRLALLNADVLGLAGPGVKIACLALVTVVYEGDLSDKLLDREANPSWQGRRYQMLKSLPADEALWDEYAEVRRRSLREHGDNRAGNAFYAANRGAMDAGADAPWAERFDPGELSAIQNAMNIKIDRPDAFASEYQNRPLVESLGAVHDLTAAGLGEKLNRVPRGTVPRECHRLTAFVDVGTRVLWWAVCGWDEWFGGGVIDYGTWPRQTRTYFAEVDARQTLELTYPGLAEEARVYRGLGDLVNHLVGREWHQQETGGVLRLDRILIDSGWLTQTVYQFVRRSPHAALLLASKGHVVGPEGTPIDGWAARQSERRGPSWRLSPATGPSGRLLVYDPNFWKTFVADRLLTPPMTAGCLFVNGAKVHEHEMLFDHLTCEFRTRVEVEKKGRVYDSWAKRPGRRDNHLFDAVIGCAVAASERGLQWHADGRPSRPKESPRPAAAPPLRAGERTRIKPTRLGAP